MSKSELILLLKRVPCSENLTLPKAHCIEALETTELLRLDDWGYKFPTEHFYKIYWGRSQNQNLDQSHFVGLLETVENLKTDHGILRAVSGDTERLSWPPKFGH
jgi:hypothetical protein